MPRYSHSIGSESEFLKLVDYKGNLKEAELNTIGSRAENLHNLLFLPLLNMSNEITYSLSLCILKDQILLYLDSIENEEFNIKTFQHIFRKYAIIKKNQKDNINFDARYKMEEKIEFPESYCL